MNDSRLIRPHGEEYDENKDRRRLMAFIPLVSPYALQAKDIQKDKDKITIYQPHEIPRDNQFEGRGLGRRIGNVHNFMVNKVVLLGENGETLAEGHVTDLEIRAESVYEETPLGTMMIRSPEYRARVVFRDLF